MASLAASSSIAKDKNCCHTVRLGQKLAADKQHLGASLGLIWVIYSSCPGSGLGTFLYPWHRHVKFSIIPRPSNAFGFDGADNSLGQKPGLLQLLERLYLRNYFEDIKAGRQPKKCLMFFRGFKKMASVHSYLAEQTGLTTADVADHVMIHADLSLATEKVIVERLNSYNIILATTRLLLG